MTGFSGFDPNALANASADRVDNDPPDVGTYEVVVDNAEAFTTESKGDFVKFELRVATGAASGHAWTELFGFKTDKAYDYFKGVCLRVGIDLDGVTSLQALDERAKGIIGQWYAVDVVASRNPQFPRSSVFFKDGPIQAGAASDVTPADAGADFAPAATGAGHQADDESIPF